MTFIAISRAPLQKIQAYKQRMGWQFPWVSSYGSDYQFDFGFAFTPEQMQADVFQQMIKEAPDWLKDWSVAVGADLEFRAPGTTNMRRHDESPPRRFSGRLASCSRVGILHEGWMRRLSTKEGNVAYAPRSSWISPYLATSR